MHDQPVRGLGFRDGHDALLKRLLMTMLFITMFLIKLIMLFNIGIFIYLWYIMGNSIV